MRNWIYPILIAVVLIVPFALRPAAPTMPGTHGEVRRLIVITPNNQDIRGEFGRAFSQWHQRVYGPAVEVDWRNVGGTVDIRNYLQTTFAAQAVDQQHHYKPGATAGIDVVWGGGDFFFNSDLKKLGILLPLDDDPALSEAIRQAFPEPTLSGVKLLDISLDKSGKPLAPRWVGSCLSSFGIVYNADLYGPRALNLPPPATWADLTDPRLAGFVALADPSHSGSAAVGYMMVVQRAMYDAEKECFAQNPRLKSLPSAKLAAEPAYAAALQKGYAQGMGRLLLIAANARYFTDSATQVPADVANGEAAVGTAIDFYGRVYEDAVGTQRCRFVLPQEATAITPDPVGILLGAPSLDLARHFIEFLLTPEGQKLWDLRVGAPGGPQKWALRRMPIRRDVYPTSAADRANWCDPKINPFEAAASFNQRGQWMAPFSLLQQIWAAQWIDSRDDLLAAYSAIRSIRDPAQRQALLDELTQLPAGMDWISVNALAADWSARNNAHLDTSLWLAELRGKWVKEFAGHYREVARDAGKISAAKSAGK